jgi:hypothetical protein
MGFVLAITFVFRPGIQIHLHQIIVGKEHDEAYFIQRMDRLTFEYK